MLNELSNTQPSEPLPVPSASHLHGTAGGDGPATGQILEFGPFRLIGPARLLLKDGHPVPIGGRAFDLLTALAQRAGKVASSQELHRLVWHDVTVEDANLRVCVAALRRALGQRPGGPRYIVTVVGRGYVFVAPVRRAAVEKAPDIPEPARIAGGPDRPRALAKTSPVDLDDVAENLIQPASQQPTPIPAPRRAAGGAPWSVVLPGLALCLTLVSYGLMGGGTRDGATPDGIRIPPSS